MPEGLYTITNVAKSASTKIRRFYEPGRARQKQFLAGRRVMHNQLLRLSAQEFEKHAPSILERVRRGIFHVTTPDGSQIYADQSGKLLIRKGQEIHDLPIQDAPKQTVPDKVEAEIEALSAEPEPVVVAVPEPVVEEPDFTAAYQDQAKPEPVVVPVEPELEKKLEPTFGKKGKRR